MPRDLSLEQALDPKLKSWMAFGTEKPSEIAALAEATRSSSSVGSLFVDNRRGLCDRRNSARVHDAAVAERGALVTGDMRKRRSPYDVRRAAQRVLALPLFPTTTIGSFPQTKQVRSARAEWKAGTRTAEEYERFLRDETTRMIRLQQAIGLDVLVHGEFERNDMVEYFGERLAGFAFRENG